MRLTFIITITLCINASASVYSQATKLSVELNNSSLVEVINAIKGQSEFGFLYNIEEIQYVKNLNVDFSDATVEEILDQVLKNYDLDYKIVNNIVVIMPSPGKTKNQTEEPVSSEQDKMTIKGKVTEENGDPMVGVTVLVKSTNVGVATNMNGEYTINVPEGYNTLVFTFIGMEEQEVEITGPVLNITLVVADLSVDEVVVTAMGMKREKKTLGYAMSKVTAEEITLTGNPVNPLSSLYGKAAGVRISGTSTGPSGGINIKIRNSVALMSGTNTRPLFVVDGVIIADQNTEIGGNTITGMDRGTGINDINGDDIESIEILKGAKAALLYGSEGANGVILISTKTGKKQKGFGVSISFSHLFHSLGVTPDFQDEFGSGYPTWWSSGRFNDDGFKLNGAEEEMFWNTTLSFGPKMDGRMLRWWDKDENGDNVLRSYTPQPNNYNELFRNGHTTNTSVSLSNASEIGSYRISFSNQDYKGIHMGFNQKRNSFNLNSNLKLSDRVRMTFVSSVSRNVNHNSPFKSPNSPTYGLNRDLKIQELWVDNYKTEDGYWNKPKGNHWTNIFTLSNRMLWRQLEDDNDETRDHLIQSVGLNVELADWLSLNARAGVDYTSKLLEYKQHAWRPWNEGATGTYRRQKSSTIYTNSDVFLNFDKQINSDFRIDGLIGGTYQERNGDYGYSETRGFNVENWFSISNSKDTPANNSATRWSEIMYSTLFSATLSYKNALFVEVQGRKDWSSILPPDNNSYFYPGVSASWIASESLSLPEWVKFGKLRAAWADVGRPGPRYFANNTYDWGSYNGVITNDSPSSLPAVALQPERKREFEVGLEANLFKNNRVGIDFSYYHNNVYDQIMSLPISQATGASSVKVNAGNIQHDGFELQLITKPVVSNDFNWDLIFNFAKDKTKIKELAKGITETALWGGIGVKVTAEVDEPYGQLYYHPYRKDDNGNRVVADNGYSHVIERDLWELKGSVVPSIIGGIGNTFRYKAFSLSFFIDYQFGAYMVSTTNMYMIGNGTSKETLKYRNEEHGGLPYYVDGDFNVMELPDHSATVPSDSRDGRVYHDGMILDGVKADGSVNDQVVSSSDYYNSYWENWMHMKEDVLYKTDYIKLRQLVLSYDIPQQIITKAGIQALQVSFVADNPWLIYTTLPNVDPEAYDGTNTYSERSQFPSMKSFGFAVKLSF